MAGLLPQAQLVAADPICSVFLLIPWFNYMFYGDDSLVNEYYDNMCRWEDFLTSQSKDGIVQYSNYGDWAGPVAKALEA